MRITVHHGQTLMDIAIQFYGSADALVDLANDNGLALDASINPGDKLIINDVYPERALSIFSDYLKDNKIVVCSGDKVNAFSVLVTNDDEMILTNDTNGILI